MTEALIGFVAIFAMALLRVPLAFGMGLVGIVGIGLTRSWGPPWPARRRWSRKPDLPIRCQSSPCSS